MGRPETGSGGWADVVLLQGCVFRRGCRNGEERVHDVDLVLDTVGGPRSSRFLRTLKRGGAQFPVPPGDFDEEEVAKLGVTVSSAQVRSNGAQLAELGRLLDAGMIRVAIDSTFSLADARAAHERAARGHIQGKNRDTAKRMPPIEARIRARHATLMPCRPKSSASARSPSQPLAAAETGWSRQAGVDLVIRDTVM